MNLGVGSGRCAIVDCFRFMRLFGISVFSVLKADSGIVRALVAWPEDCTAGLPAAKDAQEIEWRTPQSGNVDDALTVAECAYENAWIESDILHAGEDQLQRALGWDSLRISRALDTLVELRAGMIDDGNVGDAFLLHTKKGVKEGVSP